MRSALFGLAAVAVCGVLPAFASCYGTGYNRYCDGIGGPGATYSPRGSYGATTYYGSGGGVSRTQTYTPYSKSTTYYGNGGGRGYGYGSGSYYGR